MKRMSVFRVLSTLALIAPALSAAIPEHLTDGLYAEIETPRGTLTARLFAEDAPLTVTNFVGLAEGTLGPNPGRPYFDGLTFHRVVSGFVVQGGDPRGDGEGGPGYEFPDEFSPALRHHRAGMLSMANGGPDTNGSQFFITLTEVNRLNYLHSVFGEIVDGLDVLPRIEQGDTMTVRIHRLGTEAQTFRADRATFDALVATTPKAHPPHLDDPARQLPTTPDWGRIMGHKLQNLERFTGARLHVLLLDTLPPDRTGPALAADLARRAQITTRGAAAVYVADSHLWHLVLAEGTARRITLPGEATSTAVNQLLADIDEAGNRMLTERYGDKPIPPEQFRKRHLDALLDILIPLVETADLSSLSASP